MQISIHSNIGKRRKDNQDFADYYINEHGQKLFILCDGVGGSQAGDVASQKTVSWLGQHFQKSGILFDVASIQSWMEAAVAQINQIIYDLSLEEDEFYGMATTLVMAMMVDETIVVAHLGDSRAYAFTGDRLIQITEDHSLVNELVRTGEITEEEAEMHPQRNVVTQSIGGTQVFEMEITLVLAKPLQAFMLCSDGLSNMLTAEEMLAYFKEVEDADQLALELIKAANEAGGTDNITLIIIKHPQDLTPEGREV